jgi:hypothetical protein
MFRDSIMSHREYNGYAVRRISGAAAALMLVASCGPMKSASEDAPLHSSDVPVTKSSLTPNIATTPSTSTTSEILPTPTDIVIPTETPTYDAPITDQPPETQPITTEEPPTSSPTSTQPEQDSQDDGAIDTCDEAMAYLAEHIAPGFDYSCGYAWGAQAATCNDHAPECPGQKIVRINVICDISVKNEAANSHLPKEQLYNGSPYIDPFGPSC